MVDIYRLYELYSIAGQIGRLPQGDILEVGVWRGGSGALIAQAAKFHHLAGQVFLADTFCGVVKAGANDTKYQGGEHADTSLAVVESLIFKQMNLDNVRVLTGVFPDDTGSAIRNHRFRLCHIDVDVYDSARDINDWVWPRLVRGGIVVYDDYGFEPCAGVTQYVDEQRHLEDRLVIHNLNGHAVVVKLE